MILAYVLSIDSVATLVERLASMRAIASSNPAEGDLQFFSFTRISFRTVFENHRKSLIQHCERSELRLHFEWKKVH